MVKKMGKVTDPRKQLRVFIKNEMYMVHGDYRIHLTEEKNNYVVIRQNFPRLMIYVTIRGNEYELTKLTLMDNCSASVLGKVLIEFELYLKGEIGHSLFVDDSRINGWHHG